MKLALGCSASTLLIVAAVLAAVVWGGSSYVALTRADVRVGFAWSGLENACLHRSDLARELVRIGRSVPGIPAETLDRLSDVVARSEESVAGPDVLRQEEAAAEFARAQAELAAEVERLLATHGAQFEARAPHAVARLRGQYGYVCERLEEARTRLDDAVLGYNRAVGGFPHRTVAALLGFDGRVVVPEAER